MNDGDGMRRDADGYLTARGLGDARRPHDKPIRTYPRGRTCSNPACNRPLSIYNPEDICGPCDRTT